MQPCPLLAGTDLLANSSQPTGENILDTYLTEWWALDAKALSPSSDLLLESATGEPRGSPRAMTPRHTTHEDLPPGTRAEPTGHSGPRRVMGYHMAYTTASSHAPPTKLAPQSL